MKEEADSQVLIGGFIVTQINHDHNDIIFGSYLDNQGCDRNQRQSTTLFRGNIETKHTRNRMNKTFSHRTSEPV